MSVIPDQWAHPGSTKGLLYDLGWCTLGMVLFGALLYWQPAFLGISLSTTRVAGPILIGVIIGIGVIVLSATDSGRRFWRPFERRFLTMFILILGIQALLAIAPTWTILSTFVSFLVAIPARLCTFILGRRSRPDTM